MKEEPNNQYSSKGGRVLAPAVQDGEGEWDSQLCDSSGTTLRDRALLAAATSREMEQCRGDDWVQHSQEPFRCVGYDGQ